MQGATVGVSSFRSNIREYLDLAENSPVAIHRNNRIYVLMTKEHYVDLMNKIRFPHMAQMPANVQTIVHFTTKIAQSQ